MPPPLSMSSTCVQAPQAQGLPSSSGPASPSRPLQPSSESSVSKKVCFYKSGDHKFSGHRMIITARTFKTFDALLDALSKKVPLPFGVRTITTPRGTHLVKALEDLQDGGAYVCSDQKRVKPLNLDEVNRRQVPWNTTRLLSAGRRRRQGLRSGQFERGNNVTNRAAKVTERVAVRTPKKLVVIKNKDPTVKRTIVLQRRTAPTFDALLDYLSQILQFPVLKLYSTEGRRVDGLAALILCSGVVVAAGNEPFRLGNYNFQRTGQIAQILFVEDVEPPTLQPSIQKNKSFSNGRGSRNFSVSSERFIVNQINTSQNGSLSGYQHHPSRSPEIESHQHHTSMEMYENGRRDDEDGACIVPRDDDIEKSFCVNPDGSMTVEMKVRLTIKEEELLHWTTTLSRSSLTRRKVCASGSASENNSPDSNNANAKDTSNVQEDERKEENCLKGSGVSCNDEQTSKSFTSTTLGKTKTRLKRTPTPGPRHVNKKASVENVKVVTETGIQESTTGHFSYMERTEDGETAEEFCIVRHSSSSSSRPMPKPRKTASSGASNKRSSTRTSGEAEVLRIQNNEAEVTETVMHIYESQGCYDNYFANEEYSADGASLQDSTSVAESKPSTDSGPLSSSNDCDIDCNWQPPNAESLQRQKEEMLSLSSESDSLTRQVTNNPSPASENGAVNTQNMEKVKTENTPKSIKKKKISSTASTNSTDKNRKEIRSSRHSKNSSTDKMSSDASVGKKSLNSSEKSKSVLKSKGEEKSQMRSSIKGQPRPKKDSALSLPSETVTTTPPKRKNMAKAAGKDNSHDVNTPTGRPQMKKNMSDILPTKKSPSLSTKTISRPKSLIERRLSPPKLNVELSESGSVPSLNPSPSEIHQYVENWLEKVSPDSVPYAEELIADDADARTKVVFKLGDDSESEEIADPQMNVSDAMKKSSSCLSVPLFHEDPAMPLLHGEQRARGLCVSMPSVRADPLTHENKLRLHKSAEAIGPDESEMSSSNMLSPKDKMKPVLRQLCSSIQCIRRTGDATPTLHNSSSLPNFSTQVASVFGSSCKAFLSFLSVMTLRDNLKGSPPEGDDQSRTTSEAMLMMESLQKISTMEDEEKQRASLTDLQSRASSQFRERWKDFQIMRERFESEPLSPRVSETEFALDVVSEGGDLFEERRLGLDELMDELNMPQDLRQEIASTIQSFYPVDESTFVETVKHESDSEEDVEQFVSEHEDETKLSPEADSSAEDTNEARTENNESEGVREFRTEINETSKDEEVEEENPKENKEKEEWEREEGEVAGIIEKAGKNEKQEAWEEGKISDGESVEKETEEEITEDEEVVRNRLEGIDKDQTEEKDEGLAGETGNEGSAEDTDEREGASETEEEEKEQDNSSEDEEEEEQIGKGELNDGDEEERENVCSVGVEEEGKGEDEEGEAEALSDESQEEVENPCEDVEEEGNKKKGKQDEGDEEEEIAGDVEKEENSDEDEETETVEHKQKEEEENSLMEDAEEEEVSEETRKVSDEKCEEANREEEGNEKTDEDEEMKKFMEEVVERNVNEEEFSEEYKSEQKEKDDKEERYDQAENDRNEEEEVIDELEAEENMTVDEEEKVSDEEKQKSEQVEHRGSCQETNLDDNQESPSYYSSEGQCEDDKGRDTVHETDEGEEEHEAGSINLSHPGEISQELLDFVNNALQSHSLVFTYDTQGNLRIVPDNARVVQTKQGMIPIPKESSYGLKCLPSPITSDLSDYRPETSGSGGYKTQESEDIASENGEDAPEKHSQSASRAERRNQRQADSKVSAASSSEALQNSRIGSVRSSSDGGTKSSREDLSYFSAASSLKAETEAGAQNTQCDADGVLIDQGRWLLKENHLIRKSPPVSLGMYGDLDSTSVDTAQGNTSEDSPPYTKTQHNPLAAISSSELEEMAKPLTPKCTYFKMPHGSDSDPFLDDVSDKSAKHDASSVKARGFRVSPAVDTSRTWANRNGSLSSFASVEFKIPDRKVHPEGESSAVRQTRRTSSGEQDALQPQDSMESLHLRCGQYCPIL